MKCNICPRNCGVDRGLNSGFCKANKVKINKVMVHHWEEPLISGTNGSGTIFFSGCNLKCIYCQNYEISSKNNGIEIDTDDLVKIIKKLESIGVHNINFVTPTHFTNEIIEALKIYKPSIPIVWNTSGYEKPDTIEKLKDFVDVFLYDLKYKNAKISEEFSRAKDYFKYASESLIKAREVVGEDKILNGLMKKGIIIRHLVLPKNSKDSVNLINFVYKKLGNNVYFSLLNQYTPYYLAKNHPILKNKVTSLEYKRVVKHLINLNFDNAFVQDTTSSNESYIPNFNEKFDLEKFLNS